MWEGMWKKVRIGKWVGIRQQLDRKEHPTRYIARPRRDPWVASPFFFLLLCTPAYTLETRAVTLRTRTVKKAPLILHCNASNLLNCSPARWERIRRHFAPRRPHHRIQFEQTALPASFVYETYTCSCLRQSPQSFIKPIAFKHLPHFVR